MCENLDDGRNAQRILQDLEDKHPQTREKIIPRAGKNTKVSGQKIRASKRHAGILQMKNPTSAGGLGIAVFARTGEKYKLFSWAHGRLSVAG